jgi:hypothetical protein
VTYCNFLSSIFKAKVAPIVDGLKIGRNLELWVWGLTMSWQLGLS